MKQNLNKIKGMKMIKITFPNGDMKEFEKGISGFEIATSISPSLAKSALVIKLNEEYLDLNAKIETDGNLKILTSKDEEVLPFIRHSAAHIMAQAIQSIYPDAKLAIGPSIENGFYYDIDCETKITTEDFEKIEKKMLEIVKQNLPIERKNLSTVEAKKFFADKNEIYKVELISDLEKDGVKEVSIYTQGDFSDLCRGPHIPSTAKLGTDTFKITSIAGAYWRGDANNKMLQRIYATAWLSKADLDAYIKMQEEAEKRDHRKIGVAMDLFHFEPEFAPGSVFWHPKGWKLFQTLISYMRKKQEENGYIEVSTPTIMNRCLWETSGHWDKYKHNMYTATVQDEDTEFAIKPMNCPGGVLIYKQGIKSYRDLPIRMAEFGKVNRYEPSGALHGILRVREFTQDDAHIFCTTEQMEEECVKVIKLIMEIYREFGFDNVRIKLSTRPEKRIGSDETWDMLEKSLANALEHNGYEYTIFEGEGAFYGPKLEFVLRDAIGRDWQCGTLQVDMNLTERFDLNYIGQDGEKHRPVMLHRALFGSLERFTGILIENFAGHLPLWLSPVQVAITTVSQNANDYAVKVNNLLQSVGISTILDTSNEKISYKIRQHSTSKIPVIAVIGDKEVENETLTIRRLGSDKQETLLLKDFVQNLQNEINSLA